MKENVSRSGRSRVASTGAPSPRALGERLVPLIGLVAAASLSCTRPPDLWQEEPDYVGPPGQLCDAGLEGAGQATFGKLLESEGPMIANHLGSPMLGDEGCRVTCYFPHSRPDTTLQPGERVRLRGRIRQYSVMTRAPPIVTIELEPCAFQPAATRP